MRIAMRACCKKQWPEREYTYHCKMRMREW